MTLEMKTRTIAETTIETLVVEQEKAIDAESRAPSSLQVIDLMNPSIDQEQVRTIEQPRTEIVTERASKKDTIVKESARESL